MTLTSTLLEGHQQHTPANMVQGWSHCSRVTQSLLASLGNWVSNTLHHDSLRLSLYQNNCHAFPQQWMLSAMSVSYKMFGLIHNVLCSLFKITPSTLRAAWDLVMPPLAAVHVERKIKTYVFWEQTLWQEWEWIGFEQTFQVKPTYAWDMR